MATFRRRIGAVEGDRALDVSFVSHHRGATPRTPPGAADRQLISPETIALVRDRTDIVALIAESVPSLKRRGRSFVGLCPFHKEKTGSFHVNPDRGFFHCFGCKEAGSAIDFVMKHDGATFPEAVRSLAERAGVPIEEETRAPSEVDRQKKQRDDLYAVNQLAATFFERELREHAQRQYALDELGRRGLLPGKSPPIDDALQAFRIGYAPPGWDGLATFLKQQGVSPMAAETVGLLVPRSSGSGHYDRFRHRLMFAVIDPQGRVVAFSGRVLPALPGEEKDEHPAKYINSPESPVYSKGHALFGLYQARQAIRQAESATLVEGNFDVVSLHAHGIANVVAPLGTAFTVDQAKLLRRFAPNVILLFDGDAAGHKAVRLSREPCAAAGLTANVATIPAGTDPDELVRTKGKQALDYVLESARPMTESFIDARLDESLSASDAHGKLAVVSDVFKLIADEPDPLVRAQLYVYADNQVVKRLDLRDVPSLRAYREKLQTEAQRMVPRGPAGPSPREARIAVRDLGAVQRREIVGALIEFPELMDDAEVQGCLSLLEGPSAQIVRALADSLRPAPAPLQGAGQDPGNSMGPPAGPPASPPASTERQKTLDTSSFLAQITPPIQAFASERLAAPRHETREEAKDHLLENAQRLRTMMLEREANELAREQDKAAGDWETQTKLAGEANEHIKKQRGGR
jgi:DNA primase